MTPIEEIEAERERQKKADGWTPEHDDEQHANGDLARAAACYASPDRAFRAQEFAGRGYEPYWRYGDLWPWADKWWKPKDRRRDLIRAAALIIAEIERLDRAATLAVAKA
jgi:hypothetical protein